MFSYKPLWKKLIDLDINKTTLAKECNMSFTTLSKMGQDKYIDMKNLDKMCEYLKCDIEDIIQYVPNQK